MKKELKKLLLKRMEDDNFLFHRRDCHQCSDYGTIDEENGMFVPDDEIVIEEWTNKDFINWLLNIGEKEISSDAEKIDKLLANWLNK